MTWSSQDARDIPPVVNYKCHPKKECKTVFCLLCDSVWCKSDFCKKVDTGNGFFITHNVIICPAHAAITYNLIEKIDISDNEELNLLQIKISLLKKQYDNVKNGLKDAQEQESTDMDFEVQSDVDTASTTSKKRRIDDIYEEEKSCLECESYFTEIKHLRERTSELSKHNDELRENNSFLRSLVQSKEKSTNINSYASTVSGIADKQDHVQVIIEPKSNFNQDIMKFVQTNVSKQYNAKILNIKQDRNKNVILKCMNKKDSEEIIDSFKKNSSEMVTAQCMKKKSLK